MCSRVTGAMPLLTLQVAKFEAISLNRWQSHWGGQRHFHFCTFGAVCKDAWDRQHLTASYYKLLEVISCWIDAWDSQHHTGFLLCITAMVAWWICDIGTFLKCHGGGHSKKSNFPYIGNSNPNWLSYFSEGLKPSYFSRRLKPPTNIIIFMYTHYGTIFDGIYHRFCTIIWLSHG